MSQVVTASPLTIGSGPYDGAMVLRMWRGWVASDRVEEYAAYIERTGLEEYRQTPGNRGAQIVSRMVDDERHEIMTLSWWDSTDDIVAFAGTDIDLAKFYPQDDQFLLDRDRTVSHYEVARAQ